MSPTAVAVVPVAEPASAAVSRFSVHADAEPGVMPRVLQLFAKRGLVPQRWHSVVTTGRGLRIDIAVDGLPNDTAEYVANCMRQISGVNLVLSD